MPHFVNVYEKFSYRKPQLLVIHKDEVKSLRESFHRLLVDHLALPEGIVRDIMNNFELHNKFLGVKVEIIDGVLIGETRGCGHDRFQVY